MINLEWIIFWLYIERIPKVLIILLTLVHSFQLLSNGQKLFLESVDKEYYLSFKPKNESLKTVKSMFYFGFNNYMKYAYPYDELDPIHCSGRGHDYGNRDNININDVLGDYQLTLVDVLDTLVIMNDIPEFKRSVSILTETLHFEQNTTVQVFEATIRVIGSLLSAHLLIVDDSNPFGDLQLNGYSGQLLSLANDLATRLIAAFQDTETGIPHPRVNLLTGIPKNSVNETCLSGATTLLLEFVILSRLTKDPVFENVIKRTINKMWTYKSNVTGLMGSVINIQTGKWVSQMSGLGAGHDSFYEYLLKGYIAFGNVEYVRMYEEAMRSVRFYMRKGRRKCSEEIGHPPLFVNVKMSNGEIDNNWIDSLQAALPGILTLNGDLDEAICIHAYYYAIWKKFKVLPERFNWHNKNADVKFYPLRPELAESTYFLYMATKSPFYLHVGDDILENLNLYTKVKCGYATVHDVTNMSLEDRMESFFLSETCKYLFLLFDENNLVNRKIENYIFTTQGHILSIKQLRKLTIVDVFNNPQSLSNSSAHNLFSFFQMPSFTKHPSCEFLGHDMRYRLPLSKNALNQIFSIVG